MVPSRVVVLLVALICLGIATATFRNDNLSQEDGDLTKREFLEDVLTVMNDREKRRRCVDRKGRRTCKNFEMFFYSCTHKMMKKYCRATCRKC